MQELLGYAAIAAYMLANGLDFQSDEDIMDACVEVTKGAGHLTDEDLEEGLQSFRDMTVLLSSVAAA